MHTNLITVARVVQLAVDTDHRRTIRLDDLENVDVGASNDDPADVVSGKSLSRDGCNGRDLWDEGECRGESSRQFRIGYQL